MALTWSVENVKDHERVTTLVLPDGDPNHGVEPGGSIWNPVTTALVWLTLSTGIREITADNAAEFYARTNLLERVNGAQLIRAVDPETGKRPEGAAAFITPAEVEAHIGLSTNASTKTKAQFLKGFEIDLVDAARRYDRETASTVAA